MKNWNLRVLMLLRALCWVIAPLWFFVYRSGLPGAFVWLTLWGGVMFAKQRLERASLAQMDERAAALCDRLGRTVEALLCVLLLVLIVFLTQISKAEDPGKAALTAAQIAAWGLLAIQLYRGAAFWLLDKKGC